jgi:chitin synthase
MSRRESDRVDPTSSNNPQSHYSPTKYSPQKQQGHRRNFSRPFNSSASESGSIAEEKNDRFYNPPQARTDPMFDPGFTFRDGRQGSQSLQPEAQEDARRDAEKELKELDKDALARRKSSCVLVNRRKSQYTIEEEKVVRSVGKERLKWTKWVFCVFFFLANGACICISWMFEKYWWIFAPVILLGNVLNTLMVLNLTRYWLWRSLMRLLRLEKPPVQPTTPATIAMVLACYCENYDELMATLESLHAQEDIEQHKKMFLVIVDGQVKGKGMAKSTDRILVEDIFKPEREEWFPVGYESWDGVINGIYACAGIWRDVPYVCLVKKRNLGKRDGLILVRTLLYKYQFRYENPETSLGDDFFRWFCEFTETLGIEKYEWLVGVDADTTFNTKCIYEMHYKCIQDPRLIGCSGLIQVGFRTGNWNFWNLYQNAEYIRAQCLRRMHQDKGTGKVSCLPGACQIIKICEETCGDKILIDTFGHIPDPKDNMIHQIRALAGEDRNYICIIFKHYPKAITCMAMKAIAFTDPPNGLMVFLSQRKRWTLSTNANDMLITSESPMNWFERICSAADLMVWVLPIFVAQTIILFIRACINATTPVFILSFATVTIVPMVYGLVVTFWACNGWREKLQYLAGFAMVVLMGQLVTPVVIVYAIWHMDNFSWGKTREVEDDGTGASKPAHSD